MVAKPAPLQVASEPAWYLRPPDAQSSLVSPGDKLSIIVPSAPELSSLVTIGPDGQIEVPYSGPIQTTDMRLDDVRRAVEASLTSELKTPRVDVRLVERAPQPIFIGGDVGQPGVYSLPGPIDPFQALLMAGGGDQSQVLLIRRMPDGQVKSASLNLAQMNITQNIDSIEPESPVGWVELQRFDVLYVPNEPISRQSQFVQTYIDTELPAAFATHFRAPGPNG